MIVRLMLPCRHFLQVRVDPDTGMALLYLGAQDVPAGLVGHLVVKRAGTPEGFGRVPRGDAASLRVDLLGRPTLT